MIEPLRPASSDFLQSQRALCEIRQAKTPLECTPWVHTFLDSTWRQKTVNSLIEELIQAEEWGHLSKMKEVAGRLLSKMEL